ncbi:MAG: phosphatase PAP2 family protein, partial [Dokdonia donghaensis]|nr:phosphatase PAP2 family protein [Dokdonia donghaensis]
ELLKQDQYSPMPVAQQVIAYSQTDTAAEAQITDPQPFSYEPPVGEGYWTYSADEERAWFPYWDQARTFIISSEETTTVAPPVAYSTEVGSEFYTQMMDVYTTNNTAREDNNEDLWIAEFWSDDVEGLMTSPPGHQVSIANQLIGQYDTSPTASLVLLLKLGFSLNDAAVSTWADKYEYMVMRPSVYIQEYIDPTYETNLYRFINWPNPSFPGYPSGHSAFASAAAGVFIDAFGNDINFTDRSHEGRTEFRGAPRQFTSFTDMAQENGYSRIPLGVHIEMDCTEGLRLGYEVSDAVNAYNLTN